MKQNTLFFLHSKTGNVKRTKNINFYPLRLRMMKEIERCIASGRIDTLVSFCNSCIFNATLIKSEPECNACYIRQVVDKTSEERKLRNEVETHHPVAG